MGPVSSARRKVKAFIESIEAIAEMDFPYDHSNDALTVIRSVFVQIQGDLDSLDTNSYSDATKALCKRAMEMIDEYSFNLGFIVRSADIRAPELQGPLLRLTRRALGSDARLIISSEWGYSPFTLIYPTDIWRTYVWVGMPAAEAANPLICPLFGHELGHNIWQHLSLANKYEESLLQAALDSLRGEYWDQVRERFGLTDREQIQQQNLFSVGPLEAVHSRAMRQAEEIFCDLVGLAIFRAAYLHAFEYLLAPSFGQRSPGYPDMQDRAKLLVEAANARSIRVDANYVSRFDNAPANNAPDSFLQTISDRIAQARSSDLLAEAFLFCEERGLTSTNEVSVAACEASFSELVPCIGSSSISDIVSAAWNVSLTPTPQAPLGKIGAARERFIQELALKSFEIFEIEQLQEVVA